MSHRTRTWLGDYKHRRMALSWLPIQLRKQSPKPHSWEGAELEEKCDVSHWVVSDYVTPWTVAQQAPLTMGFSRQEWWSGLPFPSPGDLPDPGIKPESPALQAESTELEEEPPKSKEDLSFLKQTKACLRQVWDLGPFATKLAPGHNSP